ncbi:MAG TPA: hypothetical protein VHK01_20725 [Lacipirellulaceae bacterium]|jgi:hypothetical protein|nr:hypothetical protein [Lacipirellulaceae bacterium]
MLRSIELDDQPVRKANEVDGVWSDGRLATELKAAELPGAEQSPEALFRFGRLVAK